VTTFVDALAALGVERERDVYWAGRATLVRRPEDVAMYDRAFAAFWRGDGVPAPSLLPHEPLTLALDDGTAVDDAGDGRAGRTILLCDVSGSMDAYARELLRFLHVAVAGRTRVEAFSLGTRLTRLTRQLSTRDPDAALAAAAGSVLDWSGGTRLGDGLRAFND